jgi:hypothetical protein
MAPASGGSQHGDMTVTVKPWITADNWKDVREFVRKETGVEALTITSLEKL